MEITIDLPETTVRKVKAFGVLYGQGSDDTETTLVAILDEALTNAIITAVSGDAGIDELIEQADYQAPVQGKTLGTPPARRQNPAQQARPFYGAQANDLSGISDGLGDEDTSEDEDTDHNVTHDESAFVPSRGGLTERDLEEDMSLTDPEHEAKVEAPPALRGSRATTSSEDLFSELAGLPAPAIVDPRAASRKKKLNSKAKVSYASSVSESPQ